MQIQADDQRGEPDELDRHSNDESDQRNARENAQQDTDQPRGDQQKQPLIGTVAPQLGILTQHQRQK